MYFTKFPLNMTRRETKSMLSSPYRLHAAIAGCFPPGQETSGEGRVLWRVDRGATGPAVLYIVSPVAPSLVGLDEQIGWPDIEQQWQTRDYDPLLSKIADGQEYGFRLVANPAINRVAIRNDKDRTKRIAHVTPLHQAAWLVGRDAYEEQGAEVPEHLAREDGSRASRNGFTVLRDDSTGALRLVVSNAKKLVFPRGVGGRKITLATAQYDGVLRVENAELLRHTLTHGIGHGKGFGCGLLTLARMGKK